MNHNPRPAPPTRPQLPHINFMFSSSPQEFSGAPFVPRNQQHPPPDYPEDYFMGSTPEIQGPPGLRHDSNGQSSALSRLTGYGKQTETHWTRDEDGQVVSTMGQIHTVPSDVGTDDLDNLVLESNPLPPHSTPPPPPLTRMAQLPAVTPSIGLSGPSRMGSPRGAAESEMSDNPLLAPPGDFHRAPSPTTLATRMRGIMGQEQPSPLPRLLPNRLMSSSPRPMSPPERIVPRTPRPPNRQGRFSPFRSDTGRGPTSPPPPRRGSSLNPELLTPMEFEPQSTSSPPHHQGSGQSRFIPQTPGPRHDNLPLRSFPSDERAATPTQAPYSDPFFQPAQYVPYPEVHVNLPTSYDAGQDRRPTPNGHPPGLSQHPQARPMHAFPRDGQPLPSPPPQWPGHATAHAFSQYPDGYSPYPPPENLSRRGSVTWNGYAWVHFASPGGQDRPPLRRSTPLRENRSDADPRSSRAQGKQSAVPGAPVPASPAPPPRRRVTPPASPSDGTKESLQRRLNVLQGSVITEHWPRLDKCRSSIFESHTHNDPGMLSMDDHWQWPTSADHGYSPYKPTPDEFQRYEQGSVQASYYESCYSCSIPSNSSWQSDPDGTNVRYVGRSGEFDLEAQIRLPEKTRRTLSTNAPGHYTIQDQPYEVDTEPLPPNTTPPPKPALHRTKMGITRLSPQFTKSRASAWNGHGNARFTNVLDISGQTWSHCPVPSRPRDDVQLKVRQPQPRRPIRFDLLNAEGRLPNPHDARRLAVKCISQTYKDFLKLQQEVEERFKAKRKYSDLHVDQEPKENDRPCSCNPSRPRVSPNPPVLVRKSSRTVSPLKTSSDSGYGSDDAYYNHLIDRPIWRSSNHRQDIAENRSSVQVEHQPRSKNATTKDGTNPSQRSQRSDSVISREQQSKPPTSYAAFHCLHLVNTTLHRMDYLRMGSHLDDVEDSLLFSQDCLRRQRNLTQEQWDERYETWDMKYQQVVRELKK
ncbi:hypothetical protein DXG01_010952 [Tephrocybe rancida]|nr:hypothetical protein DXG01_010952 [Tephrocybe rancida]